jgi:DNA-binding beta-propeller fold protein YncE
MSIRRTDPILLLAPIVLLAAGCASGARYGGGGYDDDDEAAEDDDDAAFDDDDDDGDGAGEPDDDEPPPEDEDDFLGREPRDSDVYVFVPNPDRDTLTKIDAFTRAITTIDVGDEPTMVLVSSDYLRAVTFNAGSNSVSVIDVATDEVVDLPVREDFNTIRMSPDGRWVTAFFDAEAEGAEFDVEGVRSFTEVSFVDTVDLTVQSFSVGFNPKDIRFNGPSSVAVVISDSFMTVATLDPDGIELRLIDLGADPIDPPVAAEVAVTPSAAWAFVRYRGEDTIQVVDLAAGTTGELDGGDDPSDLDLTPDGLQAVVVSRGSNEVRIFDAVNPLTTPPVIIPTPATSTVGSVVLSPDGRRALLYTTALLEDRIVFWDREAGTMVERALVKPVDAVDIAPDGLSALIVHTLEDAPDEDDVFTDSHALTVVDLETWLTNPVALQARPTAWASSDDGRYTLFIMENNRNVGVIDYTTRLVDDVLVPSVPVHVGMMPTDATEDPLGWVSQAHELGRISFVAPDGLTIQTVTGFELNSDID